MRSGTVVGAVAWFVAASQLILGQTTRQGVDRVAAPARGSHLQAGVRNAAEEQFVRKLANDFSRTLAAIAANPDVTVPAGSFAGRVRSAYLQVESSKRKALRPDALKLVPLTGPARPTGMVKLGSQDLVAIRTQTASMSPALRAEFRSLLRQRFERLRPTLDTLARSPNLTPMRLPKTWIHGGVFGEADAGGRTELTLNQPQVLGFEWRTEEARATAGYWELRQQATGLLKERVLATGIVGDDPTRSGIQGSFRIDLTKHLPPQPPARGGWTYIVRIKPLPKAGAGTQKVNPDRSIGPSTTTAKAAGAGTPKEPQGVGPWSAPVVINYGAAKTPPTTFHDVYRRVHFHLDSIKLIREQRGVDDEFFHVIGFVQANAPSGTGNQYRFSDSAELLREGQEHAFNQSLTFHLPSAGDFPRAYTVLLSVLERDDGDGIFEEWQRAIALAARDAISDEVDAVFKEQLRLLRDSTAEEEFSKAREAAMQALMEATTSDFYSAWLKTILTIIIGAIQAGLPDDYYGTEVVTFLMPTNRVDTIENSYAFFVSHQVAADERVRGQPQSNGTLLVRPRAVRFYGQATYPDAGAFDGIVDIKMHWTFAGRGL